VDPRGVRLTDRTDEKLARVRAQDRRIALDDRWGKHLEQVRAFARLLAMSGSSALNQRGRVPRTASGTWSIVSMGNDWEVLT
jgi:hypothetical protein